MANTSDNNHQDKFKHYINYDWCDHIILANVTMAEDDRLELPAVFVKNDLSTIKFGIIKGFEILDECALYFDKSELKRSWENE